MAKPQVSRTCAGAAGRRANRQPRPRQLRPIYDATACNRGVRPLGRMTRPTGSAPRLVKNDHIEGDGLIDPWELGQPESRVPSLARDGTEVGSNLEGRGVQTSRVVAGFGLARRRVRAAGRQDLRLERGAPNCGLSTSPVNDRS